VQEDDRFELVPGAPPRFGLVCFRLCGSYASTKALLEAVNASGEGDTLFLQCAGHAQHYQHAQYDSISSKLIKRSGLFWLNAAGIALLSHTTLGGRYIIRCAIGGTQRQGEHVETAWRAVQNCATAILGADVDGPINGAANGASKG
jgi:hypothetical protein